MAIEPDGYTREGNELPEPGNYFIRVTRAEERESKKGNKQFVIDYCVADEEGGDLGFREVRFEMLTYPKITLPHNDYAELKKRVKKKQLSDEEFVRYKMQADELRKFQWRVDQFEEAFSLKRPYAAEDLVGKIARAEIDLEPNLEGHLYCKVKAWISPAKFAAAHAEQGFGQLPAEAEFPLTNLIELPEEIAEPPAEKPPEEIPDDVWQ